MCDYSFLRKPINDLIQLRLDKFDIKFAPRNPEWQRFASDSLHVVCKAINVISVNAYCSRSFTTHAVRTIEMMRAIRFVLKSKKRKFAGQDVDGDIQQLIGRAISRLLSFAADREVYADIEIPDHPLSDDEFMQLAGNPASAVIDSVAQQIQHKEGI